MEEQEHEQEEQNIENGEELLRVKQKERQMRKGQKKKSLLRGFLRFFTTVAIIGGVGWFCTLPGWFLPKDAFSHIQPSVIQVVNNKIVKPPRIQRALKDISVPNVPIFLAGMSNVKRALLDLAPVEEVYVRRYAFPARVLIIVREATPVVTIAPAENVKPVAAFTKEGRLIIGSEYLPLPKEYKTILVLSYGNKGDDYRKWNSAKIKEIEKITKYVETFSREPVEYLDLRNPKDVFVKIKSTLIRLGAPDDKIYERIKRIPSIMPEAKKVQSKVKYVDVSWEKVNYLKLK